METIATVEIKDNAFARQFETTLPEDSLQLNIPFKKGKYF